MLIVMRSKASFLTILLCFVATSGLAAPTTATLETARDKSLAYLILQQNGDGSWGTTQSEKVRVTATVLDTFRKYNVSGLIYRRGINWLANAEATSIDAQARQVFTLATLDISSDIDKLLNQGILTSNGTLWGPLDSYRYTTLDSSLALQALALAQPGYDISAVLSYLKSRRNTSAADSVIGSGWGFCDSRFNVKDVSRVISSSQMLLFLNRLGGSHWGQSADRAAAHWLALQQQDGGAISDNDLQADVETALAVQALGYAKDVSGAAAPVLPSYETGLEYLLSRQNSIGDIDSDIYKTALAAQAWFNQAQALTDTDSDGIPDSVEAILGTNPNVVDIDYLEPGNGDYFDDTSGGLCFFEIVKDKYARIQLDTKAGVMELSSGEVPAGMTLRPNVRRLTGRPTAIGNYSLSYRIVRNDGSYYFGTAHIRVVNPDSDTDNDGMSASYEATYSSILSDLNSNDAGMDSDGDGITNFQEYIMGSNPTLTDSDGDGMPDGWEVRLGLDPNVNDAQGDIDGDTITNINEYLNGTNPIPLCGDLSDDTYVDLTDLIKALQVLSGMNITPNLNGDCNGDSQIGPHEAFTILQLISGN